MLSSGPTMHCRGRASTHAEGPCAPVARPRRARAAEPTGFPCHPRCPKGFSQKGDTCYRIKDAGAQDASQDELNAGDGSDDPTTDARPGETDSQTDPSDACPDDACAGGTCVDELDGWSCACAEGYAGTGTKQCTKVDECPNGAVTCEVDPCNPSPCGTGFTCNRTPSATPSCVANCASSDLGCQAGDPCSTDEECRTGDDSSASCDPTDKVCVTVCPTTSIVSELNLDAARYCREIDGDLILNPSFATIPAGALPCSCN